MDNDTKELIRLASELIDENGRCSFGDTNRVETLIALILDDIAFSRRDHGLSKRRFELNIRRVIGQIDDEDEIDSAFLDLIGSLKEEMGTQDEIEYSVVFALPIELPDEIEDKSFNVQGLEVKQVSKDVWETEFLEEAQSDISFNVEFSKSPYESPEEGSFWKTTVRGIDPEFAIEETLFALRTLLGEINYLHHYNRIRNQYELHGSVWPSSWSRICLPFALFVFHEGEFNYVEFSNDARPRDSVAISSAVIDAVDEIPTIGNNTEFDQSLVSGLHQFFSGMTNPDRTGAFLDFWRGLETLTQSEPGDSSSDITDRAKKPLVSDNKFLFDNHIEKIVDKRNNLVHGETSTDITQADVNKLKSLHETLLMMYFENRGNWEMRDIKFILHQSSLGDVDRLKQQKDAREENQEKIDREMEILEELIDE